MDTADLNNRFRFHTPRTDDRANAHRQCRGLCGVLAEGLNALLPEGREKALAMTNLEQVMFWSNAALARQAE